MNWVQIKQIKTTDDRIVVVANDNNEYYWLHPTLEDKKHILYKGNTEILCNGNTFCAIK